MAIVTNPPPIPAARNPHAPHLPAAERARAVRDARRTLAAIDWSRPVIVLWLPGTNRRGIPSTFAGPARRAWGARGASVVEVQYPNGPLVRQGVATGLATLRLVLAGIAAHSGRPYRVHLAGESQGAWVVSEALRDPRLRRQFDRAVLLGHPAVAASHYEDGHDPRVMEVNHQLDVVARPLRGDATAALDAAEGVIARDPGSVPGLLRAAGRNPYTAWLLAVTGLRLLTPRGADRDPHNYEEHMPAAVAFLRVGDSAPATGLGELRARRRRAPRR